MCRWWDLKQIVMALRIHAELGWHRGGSALPPVEAEQPCGVQVGGESQSNNVGCCIGRCTGQDTAVRLLGADAEDRFD